jgi:hypothetical protein
MAPTHDDATLLVELAKLAAISGVPDAARKVFAADFDGASAEITDIPVQCILNFNETIATLVKHNLLDRALVDDWIWIPGIWERLGPAVLRARERTGATSLYENVEALAQRRHD